MTIFKTVQMSSWDIGVLKLAVGFIGIAIGSTWADIFAPYALIFSIIGLAAGLYAVYTWAKK